MPSDRATNFLAIPEFSKLLLGKAPCFGDSFSFQSLHQPYVNSNQQGQMVSLQPRIVSIWPSLILSPRLELQKASREETVSNCPLIWEQLFTVQNCSSSNSCCFHSYLMSSNICSLQFIFFFSPPCSECWPAIPIDWWKMFVCIMAEDSYSEIHKNVC